MRIDPDRRWDIEGASGMIPVKFELIHKFNAYRSPIRTDLAASSYTHLEI